ncbi:MAG: tetratricopeptide repeat protein [Candidatus Thiodiazotropha sp.]
MSGSLSTAIKKLKQGKLSEASKLLSRVIKKESTNTQAQYLYGECLLRQNRIQEASDHIMQAISAGIQEPCIYFLSGMVLEKSGQYEEAEKSYDLAERLGCTKDLMYHVVGSFNANITKNYAKAEIYFAKVLSGKPDADTTYLALSKLYNNQGRYEEALQVLDRCLANGYETAEVYVNLGHALSHQGRQEEALTCCKKALDLAPNLAIPRQNYLAQLLYLFDDEAEIYPQVRTITKTLNARSRKKYSGEMNCLSGRKLKLAFVSADFRNHAISNYFMPVLNNLSRERFHVYLYSNNVAEDHLTEVIKTSSNTWFNCSRMDDKQFEKKIRADKIDILVDLSNNTAGNRLTAFLNRPAPMQVSMMGLQMSTGLDCMDFALRDEYTTEKCQLENYSAEKVLTVKDCAYFDPLIELPPVSAPPSVEKGYITFGSFNGLKKIDKRMIEVWAKLLSLVPGSVIRLMTEDYDNSHMRDYLYDSFAQFDVEQSRLLLQPRLPLDEFLESHNEVDIALDPYPYHGETTSYLSLLMGLPLVSRCGNSSASNVSNRILAAINREHWVATDFDQYIEIAVRLANDVDELVANRKSLRGDIENSSLMDFKQVTQNIENALLSGWQSLCDSRQQDGR